MSNADTAALATRVFMADLKLRKGFGELIAEIPDWPKIEACMCQKVERALNEATAPKETDGELEFD